MVREWKTVSDNAGMYPALNINHLRVTVSSCPLGNIPRVTVTHTPRTPKGTQRTRGMKQNMQRRGHLNPKRPGNCRLE